MMHLSLFFQQHLWLLTAVLPLLGQLLFWTLVMAEELQEHHQRKAQRWPPKPQRDQIRAWARDWNPSPPAQAAHHAQATQPLGPGGRRAG